jgi:hypothetical protein
VLPQVVSQLTPTVTVVSNNNPSTFEQYVTFTATVHNSSHTPTGTVKFYSGADSIGVGTLNGSGVATLNDSMLFAGSHSITVVYSGDSNFKADTSAVLTQVVNKATPTVTLISNNNPSMFEQYVTFTATVHNSSHTPTGNVKFYDGTDSIGVGTLNGSGVATLNDSLLNAGSHPITVIYCGDSNFRKDTSAVLNQIVGKATPTVSLASSGNPSIFTHSITLTATVTGGSYVPTGTVKFYDSTDSIGVGTLNGSGHTSMSTSLLTAGAHSITAVYGGDGNFRVDTSSVVSQIVKVTIADSAGPNGTVAPNGIDTLSAGQSVTVTITPETGYHIVNVAVDTVSLGAVSSHTFSNVSANHTLVATFAIDTLTITASAGPNGSISPTGSVAVTYGSSPVFHIVPNVHYVVAAIVVDGTDTVATDTPYTFTNVGANHSIQATFKLESTYATMFRTFTYDSMIVKTATVAKAAYDYWEFTIKNPPDGSTLTQMTLVFKNAGNTILDSAGWTYTNTKATYVFNGSMLAGDSIVIKGRTSKATKQQISKLYFGAVTKYSKPVATKVLPTTEYFENPMPNAASVLDYLYLKNAFAATNGMLVGIADSSAKKYGWVLMSKSASVYGSMIYKTIEHSMIDTGFNFKGMQKSLPPSKQNNLIFADLMTLHMNIALSAIGATPRGFGELELTQPGNPYNGMLVRQIDSVGNWFMTVKQFADTADARIYDNTLEEINSAFSGPIDTTYWRTDSLSLTGAVALINVPFLSSTSVTPAVVVTSHAPDLAENNEATSKLPETPQLYQNYPNPFNPTTTIRFDLPNPAIVTMKIYNILGQEVKTLLDHQQVGNGTQEVSFNAANLASGVYFYHIVAESTAADGSSLNYTDSKKMMLVK